MTAPTIPTDAAGLQDMLADTARMSTLFNDDGTPSQEFGEFIRNYAAAQPRQDQQQLEELIQAGIQDYLRGHGVSARDSRLDLRPSTPTGQHLHSADAPGARVDQLVGSHRDYLRGIWYRNQQPHAVQLQEQLRGIRNEFGSTIPSDGGFLIPETLRSTLLSVALEMAVVRPRATVIPMETLRVPLPTIDSTSNENSVFGGMIGYWTEEAGELQRSAAKFGRVVLEAKKLTGYSEVPNELFADAVASFMGFLQRVWPQAIAYFEDLAFLAGSGVGEPLGALNGSAAVNVSRAGAGEIAWADVISMFSRMLPSSLGSSVWVASINTLPQLTSMTIGTSAVPAIWLSNGQAIQGPPMQLLGRPVVFTEKVPALGSTGDLNLIDFSYYLLGDRQAMEMDTSQHYKFANDVTAVRIIERADGRPWLQSALTPHNGGPTLSPIVKLGPNGT